MPTITPETTAERAKQHLLKYADIKSASELHQSSNGSNWFLLYGANGEIVSVEVALYKEADK